MQKNAEISARISQLIDYLNLNPNSFSKKLQYDRSQVVYDILNGKALPSSDFYIRLKNSEYSDISIDWIITGEGPMLKQDNAQPAAADSDLPPGPCRQCELRERLLAAQEEIIAELRQQLNDLRVADQPKTKQRSA